MTSNDYAERLNALSSKTVESILTIGTIFNEAKAELLKPDYEEFLRQTRYAERSSSIRKWEVIGKSYMRLKPLAHILPPNWSTIYKLAALDPQQLDLLTQRNILSPTVTAAEIDAEIKVRRKAPRIRLIVDFEQSIDKDTASQVIESMSKLVPDGMGVLIQSPDLQSLLSTGMNDDFNALKAA